MTASRAAAPTSRRLFPVGLYATLLLAFLTLLRPSALAPLESTVQAIAALPLRAVGAVAPATVAADARAAVRQRSLQRTELFWRRVEAREQAKWPATVRALFTPFQCRVVGLRGRGSRLVLDRAFEDVRGAAGSVARFATLGDRLIGFVDAPPADSTGARPEGTATPIEVTLLEADGGRHGVAARRVPAACTLASGETLRFVIEPAAPIDPWPLRCTLLDDPYLAATVQQDGQMVRTRTFVDDPLGAVPPGLEVGVLRVWGYERGGDAVPIGFFVEPVLDAARSPVVTLWRRRSDTAVGLDPLPGPGGRAAVRFERVPLLSFALHASRWFAVVPFDAGALAVGTPIVRDNLHVGTVAVAGRGFAIIRPFGAPDSTWSGHFVSAADGTDPERSGPLTGRVLAARVDGLQIRIDVGAGQDSSLPAGTRGALFSSAVEGVPGMWLGDLIVTERAVGSDRMIAELHRGAEAAQPGGLQALRVRWRRQP